MSTRPKIHECNADCIGDQHAVLLHTDIDGELTDADLVRFRTWFAEQGYQLIHARNAYESPVLTATEAAERYRGRDYDGAPAHIFRYPVLCVLRKLVRP